MSCYAGRSEDQPPRGRLPANIMQRILETLMSEEAFIYEAIRTPRGKQRGGALNEVKPVNLVVGLIEDCAPASPTWTKP